MSTFTDAFRKNVTIRGALSAMLYSEELQGSSELATKTQIAIENVHSDLVTSAEARGRSTDLTEDDAIQALVFHAASIVRNDVDVLPDEAILQVIESHQKRHILAADIQAYALPLAGSGMRKMA